MENALRTLEDVPLKGLTLRLEKVTCYRNNFLLYCHNFKLTIVSITQ
jgi:hypothetical protein